MKKVRFAIIGCGRIAYRHIEAIESNSDAILVSICDLDTQRANERFIESKSKPKIYSNYHIMLKQEEIDVVCLMTPSGIHTEHAMDIIQRYKKHLVIEKPIGLSILEVNKLIELESLNNIKVFPVHQNRFNLSIKKIRETIDQNLFGKISLATIRIRWSRDQPYYDRDTWRGTWSFDGGVLTNQSIHHIDILQWLMGEIVSVSAIIKTQFVNIEVEDTACAWIKFKNGALGIIEATTTVRPNVDIEASLSIIGEKGLAVVEGSALNKVVHWTLDNSNIRDYSEEIPNVYGFGHNELINNVVSVLLSEGECLISSKDALKSLEVLHSLYFSAENEGLEVFLNEKHQSSRLGVKSAEYERIAKGYRVDSE